MSNLELAQNVYRKFSTIEGNKHIASLYALTKIVDIVDENRPSTILEIGLGIGSVSDAILGFVNRHNLKVGYAGTEANEFCLSQLPLNLGAHFEKISIFSDVDQIPKQNRYDLIIVDGSDASLEKLTDLVSDHAVIFIEGDRAPQEERIRKLFPKHIYCQSISSFRNPDYGPFSEKHWSSGGKLIYVNPTIGQRISHFREKLRTAFLYRKRTWFK